MAAPTPPRRDDEDEDTRTVCTATTSGGGGGHAKLARAIGAEAASAVIELSRAVHAQSAAKQRLAKAAMKEQADLAAARKAASAAKRAAHRALCAAGIRGAVVCRGVRVRVSPAQKKGRRLDEATARLAVVRACEAAAGLDTTAAQRVADAAFDAEPEKQQQDGTGGDPPAPPPPPSTKTTTIKVELIDA